MTCASLTLDLHYDESVALCLAHLARRHSGTVIQFCSHVLRPRIVIAALFLLMFSTNLAVMPSHMGKMLLNPAPVLHSSL